MYLNEKFNAKTHLELIINAHCNGIDIYNDHVKLKFKSEYKIDKTQTLNRTAVSEHVGSPLAYIKSSCSVFYDIRADTSM